MAASAIYIYSALKTAKAYTFTIPNLKLMDKISSLKNFINTGKFDSEINKIKNDIKNQGEDLATKASKNLKNGIFNFVKRNMNKGLDALGSGLGADVPNAESQISCPN